jgi:hypothetical protein
MMFGGPPTGNQHLDACLENFFFLFFFNAIINTKRLESKII